MENQRVRLSRAMLKKALISLLNEKPLGRITVLELCQRAEINRTTFYKYYGSPNDLMDEITDDFFSELDAALNTTSHPDIDTLLSVLEFINTRRDILRILINTISDEVFSERLFGIAVKTLDSASGDNVQFRESKYMKLFLFQGGYAVIRSWLNNDEPEPASEIADLIQSLWMKLVRPD